MSEIIIYAAAFIVAIGVIVAIHEYGHFIVARWMGVKVLRFSVGFGRPLWKRVSRQTGTEYVVASIPLGGYVKMVDEGEDSVAPEDLPYAFNRKPLWRRAAIVAAGPMFNFLFAFMAYALMLTVGVDGMVPRIGAVSLNSLADQAGLQADDVILSVNGNTVQTWEQAGIVLIDEAINTGKLDVQIRDKQGSRRDLQLDLSDTKALLDEGYLLDKIGIEPWNISHVPAVIGQLVDGEPAQKSGLQEGDRILAVNGEPLRNWGHWVEQIRANANKTLSLRIQRRQDTIELQLTPRLQTEASQDYGYIGAAPNVDERWLEQQRVRIRYGLLEAGHHAVDKTAQMTWLTIQLLGKLISGQASLKNVSGPISIAEYAGISATLGLAQYLGMLAIISISIGILNLLPIPMLDGGHLMYYAIEAMTGKPVSQAVMEFGQRIGIFILISLMGLAFYNDITRIFG